MALADLQATARTLGFVNSLQNRSAIRIGIVYPTRAPGEPAKADQVASQFSSLPGPGSAKIVARSVATSQLADTAEQFDALYLMPGAASANALSDFVRRRRLLSLSSDPACLDAQCCVLMVQAGSNVNIVMNTQLARTVGAEFSSVFTMMVHRR